MERLSDELIQEGIAGKAQDLYILPSQQDYQLYFRKSTAYFGQRSLPKELALQLIGRFKFLGSMDVGEKRKAQYGSLLYELPDTQKRLRLSSVGDYQQRESLVIRFLHDFAVSEERYLLPAQVQSLMTQCGRRGLYLFCGPVGSGKTTLMYRLAKEQPGRVLTIEDPIEIEEPTFLQLQVNVKIRQDYDELIRLSLRHHPDLLIIGEIRDHQTAQGAIRAALTGHTVFATLHASCLTGILPRLQELGCEESLIREVLQVTVYQELRESKLGCGLLLGYQFYEQGQLLEEQRFEESIKEVKRNERTATELC